MSSIATTATTIPTSITLGAKADGSVGAIVYNQIHHWRRYGNSEGRNRFGNGKHGTKAAAVRVGVRAMHAARRR
jgi:hypothetical protein